MLLLERRLVVLIYHRVLRAADPLRTGDPTEEEFDRHMSLLARWFNPLPLREAVSRLRRGRLPARAVCVTFDDGYVDNLTAALPILERHSIPATFFIASGYLDGGAMWNDVLIDAVAAAPERLDLSEMGLGVHTLSTSGDRARLVEQMLPKIKYLPVGDREAACRRVSELAGRVPSGQMLTRKELVRLAAGRDVEIGAHSVTHPILKGLDADCLAAEVRESKAQLEAITTRPVVSFAYPNGKPGRDFDGRTTEVVESAGYEVAVSTAYGSAGSDSDPFAIPRVDPWDKQMSRLGARLYALSRTARFNQSA